MKPQPIVIAIDGTSASGKSTNAKLVATKLGYVYVDTGAMYRTLAWHSLQKRIDVHDSKGVTNGKRSGLINHHGASTRSHRDARHRADERDRETS